MYTPRDFDNDMNKVITRRNKELSGLEGAKLRAKVLEIIKAAIDNTPIKDIVEVKSGNYCFPICYTENGLEIGIGSAVITYEDEMPFIQLLICHNKDDKYDKKDVIDIALTNLAEAQSKAISDIEEEIKSLNKKRQELSGKLIMINDMRLKRRDTHCISTRKELFDHVMEEYRKDTVELNGLFFDFPVKMKKVDILETYAELQDEINGDDVVRMENGEPVDELIPAGEFEDVYEGNCKEFLEKFNDGNIVDGYVFARFDGDDCLDFIF